MEPRLAAVVLVLSELFMLCHVKMCYEPGNNYSASIYTVTDPGEPRPLSLDETACLPPPLRMMDDRKLPPPPYLKARIRHCYIPGKDNSLFDSTGTKYPSAEIFF